MAAVPASSVTEIEPRATSPVLVTVYRHVTVPPTVMYGPVPVSASNPLVVFSTWMPGFTGGMKPRSRVLFVYEPAGSLDTTEPVAAVSVADRVIGAVIAPPVNPSNALWSPVSSVSLFGSLDPFGDTEWPTRSPTVSSAFGIRT